MCSLPRHKWFAVFILDYKRLSHVDEFDVRDIEVICMV